ncbi:MAG TPA: family 1 encapsulin nanocompartment shell protein [Acetobacteraceae bacterium]|jgi:uncharacterized linocin/CFP29 family protein
MDHLFRELAPISDTGWQEIEKEATRTLKTTLAARKLVDFVGPLGWQASAVGIGRTRTAEPPPRTTVQARLREVLPLVELRIPFELSRAELDALDRGAQDFDTDPIIAAARQIAIAEDRAVFHGYAPAGIRGMCTQAESSVEISATADYPALVAAALNHLRAQGVGGPFAVALSERCYAELTEATEGGYPVLQHVRRLIDGPLVWAPGLDGALVVSMRGGDFELTVGQDFSIGYLSHDADRVRLYIEESFTFWLQSPQAAVPLVFPQAGDQPRS